MKLLVICNVEAYRGGRTDVPETIWRCARRFEVWLAHPSQIAESAAGEQVAVWPLPPGAGEPEFFSVMEKEATEMKWDHFDLVFDRTLKPFPPGLYPALIKASQRVPFVNDPSGIARQHDSASFVLEHAGAFLPDAEMVSSSAQLEDYMMRYPQAVLKLGNSCGGQGVYRISKFSFDSGVRVDHLRWGHRDFETMEAAWSEMMEGRRDGLVMRYLEKVVLGDKRVIVVGGVVYGAYLRRAPNSWLQNVSAGGQTELATVNEVEELAIRDTAPKYQKMGLRILGYDFLRDDDDASKVSEINAGNIGGILRVGKLGDVQGFDRFLDWLEGLGRSL